MLNVKNVLGVCMIKTNYFLGSYSVPVANMLMKLFSQNIRFKRRADISSDVYEVTEWFTSSTGQKESVLRHYFHLSQRLHNYFRGIQKKGQRLAEEYGIDLINYNPDDIILDVGANSGDSLIFFRKLDIPLSIYCFEPDPKALESLYENAASWCGGVVVVPNPLGEIEDSMTLYLSTLGGDTSLSQPPIYDTEIVVQSLTLDSWAQSELQENKISKTIKLMKLEAEGFEPEIIRGGLSILSKIEYIAADLGWERGLEQDCTIPEVVNLLLTNRFRIKTVSRDGGHFLFENIDLANN